MTTTIKNAKQINTERKRLHQRHEELKEVITSEWSDLTDIFHANRSTSKHTTQSAPAVHLNGSADEDSILVSTLTYAGSLLGRKLGIKVQEKVHGWFAEK